MADNDYPKWVDTVCHACLYNFQVYCDDRYQVDQADIMYCCGNSCVYDTVEKYRQRNSSMVLEDYLLPIQWSEGNKVGSICRANLIRNARIQETKDAQLTQWSPSAGLEYVEQHIHHLLRVDGENVQISKNNLACSRSGRSQK